VLSLNALLELGMELGPFLLSTRLDLQNWYCPEELRLRFANSAVPVLVACKSCPRAREKLERREKEGIRGFDIVGPNRWSIDGLSILIIQKV
jgi:hypothetical protein